MPYFHPHHWRKVGMGSHPASFRATQWRLRFPVIHATHSNYTTRTANPSIRLLAVTSPTVISPVDNSFAVKVHQPKSYFGRVKTENIRHGMTYMLTIYLTNNLTIMSHDKLNWNHLAQCSYYTVNFTCVIFSTICFNWNSSITFLLFLLCSPTLTSIQILYTVASTDKTESRFYVPPDTK